VNQTDEYQLLKNAALMLNIGVWSYDLSTDQLSTNEITDQLLGMKVSTGELRELALLIEQDERENLIKHLELYLQYRSSALHEFWYHHPQRGRICLALQLNLESDCPHGTLMEVTKTKLREEEYREALFYRDEFLAIASHELKTPLTSLKLQSQVFMRAMNRRDAAVWSQDRVLRFVEQADRQVTRLTKLVNDMLDISRIRTGKLNIALEPHDLGMLVRELVTAQRPTFERSFGHAPLLVQAESGQSNCDRSRMEQVLLILMNNAMKYGQGKPVEIRVLRIGDCLEVRVSDQGHGIAIEDQERIFTRFSRAIPASEVSGLGLGLYIARQIIEAHAGEISVSSVPAQGSTFSIRLPVLDADQSL
jgi:signal transduction histidine kinase